MRPGHDLIEIFDDHRRIDDDRSIVIERGHHAIGIEGEIIGLELIASQQIKLHLGEGKPLGIEDEAHPLAAGGWRRVIEGKGHDRVTTQLSSPVGTFLCSDVSRMPEASAMVSASAAKSFCKYSSG